MMASGLTFLRQPSSAAAKQNIAKDYNDYRFSESARVRKWMRGMRNNHSCRQEAACSFVSLIRTHRSQMSNS
jgi:hypothetical protein